MKRTKTNPFDWALIQWARLCEESKIVDPTKVEPTLDPEKDDMGRLSDPLAWLASRAKKTLASLGLDGARWLDRSVSVWFASALFVVALGALVFPIARADRILDGDVNLAGPFVFFILGQLFFLALSLVLLFVVAFQALKRRITGKDRPRTASEKFVAGLSGIVGAVVLLCLQRIAPVFFALCGKKGTEPFAWRRRRDKKTVDPIVDETTGRSVDPGKKGAALFWDALFSKPRFLFFWGGFLSHLFWTSCSLCVLGILCARMQGNQYDYRWRTSLENETTVKKVVDFLGTPMAALGFAIPSEEDVGRLFRPDGIVEDAPNGAQSQKSEPTEAEKTAASSRKRWSYFLLGVVFFWCVTPRFLLVCVYYGMFRRSLRDYRPNLADPYYEKLIQAAETYQSTTQSSFVDDPIEASAAPMPAVLPAPSSAEPTSPQTESAPAAQPSVSEPPSASAAPSAPEPPAPQAAPAPVPAPEPEPEPEPPIEVKPTETLAFGYDAELTAEQWRAILPVAPEPRLFGDVAGDFARKKALREFLAAEGGTIALCVYVTDVGLSPAKHYTKFMREVLTPAIPNARVYVVLTGAEKLRVKYGSQTNAVAERLEDWTNALSALERTSGLPILPVFFYDADLDLPEQRGRLRDLVRSGGDPRESGEIRRRDYAKWDAASRRLLAECRAIFGASEFATDEETERRRAAQVCADIFEVYQAETERVSELGAAALTAKLGGASVLEKARAAAAKTGTAFSSALTGGGANVMDSLAERCKEKGLSADFVERRVMSAWGLSEKMRGFCSKLSPKCAAATATVGLSIPALVAFAPLLGGAATATAVASAFGALGTLLPASVASGVAAGALGAVAPMSLSALKEKLSAKLHGAFHTARADKEPEPRADGAAKAGPDEARERAESAAALVCVAATWQTALELQGLPEDAIASAIPEILEPIETSNLDSLEEIERALNGARALLPGA